MLSYLASKVTEDNYKEFLEFALNKRFNEDIIKKIEELKMIVDQSMEYGVSIYSPDDEIKKCIDIQYKLSDEDYKKYCSYMEILLWNECYIVELNRIICEKKFKYRANIEDMHYLTNVITKGYSYFPNGDIGIPEDIKRLININTFPLSQELYITKDNWHNDLLEHNKCESMQKLYNIDVKECTYKETQLNTSLENCKQLIHNIYKSLSDIDINFTPNLWVANKYISYNFTKKDNNYLYSYYRVLEEDMGLIYDQILLRTDKQFSDEDNFEEVQNKISNR